MPDEHYPDGEYGAGVPDLSGLDFAVDMMRKAQDREICDSNARAELAKLAEELRQAHIIIGGLRQNLDEAKSRAEHIHKTNRDLIGCNNRLREALRVTVPKLLCVGYRQTFDQIPNGMILNLGGQVPKDFEPGSNVQALYIVLED